MKPINEMSNINIIGKWNPYIFTPDWMKQNILKTETVMVEYNMDNKQTRFVGDKFFIYPDPDKIIVDFFEMTNESMSLAEEAAVLILEKLPHTPINAVGVNYVFLVEEAPKVLINMFQLDDEVLLREKGATYDTIEIKRPIIMKDSLINLSLLFDKQNNSVRIHLNFHKNVSNTHDASLFLKNRMVSMHQEALTILAKVYGLRLEEAGSD